VKVNGLTYLIARWLSVSGIFVPLAWLGSLVPVRVAPSVTPGTIASMAETTPASIIWASEARVCGPLSGAPFQSSPLAAAMTPESWGSNESMSEP
jgi:hypothetical protein